MVYLSYEVLLLFSLCVNDMHTIHPPSFSIICACVAFLGYLASLPHFFGEHLTQLAGFELFRHSLWFELSLIRPRGYRTALAMVKSHEEKNAKWQN